MQDPVRVTLERDADLLLNDLRPMVRYRCATPQESEELARDVFVQSAQVALERADSYRPSQPFRLWFLGIARMCLRKRFSSYERRTVSADAVSGFWETMVGGKAPDVADSVLDQDWVARLMEQLSPEDRDILTLSVVEELSSEEIGRRLGIASGTARMRLLRALERAQKRAAAMDRISVPGGRR